MSGKTKRSLSAEVALRSASGKSFNGQTAITSENIADYLPSRETLEQARRAFVELGFEVSEPAGLGFSITAPARVFSKVFKIKILPDERGGIKAAAAKGLQASYELPKAALPKELAQQLVAVSFSPPPDFGPGNF
jgi:hypothetical protein